MKKFALIGIVALTAFAAGCSSTQCRENSCDDDMAACMDKSQCAPANCEMKDCDPAKCKMKDCDPAKCADMKAMKKKECASKCSDMKMKKDQ